jgi:hypothetical protein
VGGAAFLIADIHTAGASPMSGTSGCSPLSQNAACLIPEPCTHYDYAHFVQKLPQNDPPEAFGQHLKADTSSPIHESNALLSAV